MNKRKSMIILATLVAILVLGPIFATQTFAGKGEPGVDVQLTILTADGTEMTGEVLVCNETGADVILDDDTSNVLSQRNGKGKNKVWAGLGFALAVGTELPADGNDIGALQIAPDDCRKYEFTLEYDATGRSLEFEVNIEVEGNPGENFTDQDSVDID